MVKIKDHSYVVSKSQLPWTTKKKNLRADQINLIKPKKKKTLTKFDQEDGNIST